MRTFFAVTLVVSILASQTASQTPNQENAKPVTVTGCIRQGVECFRLVDPADPSKFLYSIARTDKLKVGHAYRITGPVSDVGFCMEGKPILSPKEITEVKLKCADDSAGKTK